MGGLRDVHCWDKHLGRRIRVVSWVNSSVVETGYLRLLEFCAGQRKGGIKSKHLP